MQLHKTELARSALSTRTDGISIRDRRILILSDGQRNMDEIAALLGVEARASILRLVQEGYLQATPTRGSPATPDRDLLGSLQQAANAMRQRSTPWREPPPVATLTSQESVAAATTTVATAAIGEAQPAQSPRPAARRSLAAAKMYVLDMLQLQRREEAISLRATIQTSVGQDAILAAVIDAVVLLQQVTSSSYGKRVLERVSEIIPEEALPQLRARCQLTE